MFYTSQRTIYGMELQLAQCFGKEYKIKPNTSLNQLHDILANETFPPSVYPTIKYIAIGNGGITSADNDENSQVYPYSYHSPLDAGMFNMVPFVIKPEGDDLSPERRLKYRLRKKLTIKSNVYYAYYLKALNYDTEVDYKDDFYLISHRGTVDTIDIYNTATKDHLHPTPVTKIDKILSSNSSNVTKLGKVTFELTKSELDEVKEACELLETETTLTEMALVTGYDKISASGTEVIGSQIFCFCGMKLDLKVYTATTTNFYRTIDLGGSEPLFVQ